jgi:gliding motility-associated-like protein
VRAKQFLGLITCLLIVFHAQAQPAWQWATQASSINHEEALDVAVDDANGFVYIVGRWSGALDATFGAGAGSQDFTTTYGGEDGFVAKYDLTGTLIWAFKVGGSNNDAVTGVAVGPSGNIYITGYFDGVSEYEGTISNAVISATVPFGGLDIVEASYDANGELRWMWEDGDTGDDQGKAVVTNPGGVYFTGHYTGTAEIGGNNTFSLAGGTELYVLKRSFAGTSTWIIDGASDADDSGNDIAADANNIYLIGNFSGTDLTYHDYSFNPSSTIANSSVGTNDITLLCMDDGTGNFQWHTSIGSALDDFGNGITLDASGFYCTGATNINPTFPGVGIVAGQNAQDIFVSGHNLLTGDANWAFSEVGNNTDLAHSIAADQLGSIYVTGEFLGTTDFSSNNLTTTGSADIFVAKYSNAGVINWVDQAGDDDQDVAFGIASYQNDQAFVAGMFEDDIDFPPLPTITSDPTRNIFLAEIQLPAVTAPAWCWAEDAIATSDEQFNDLATDPTTGTSYAVGFFNNDISAEFPTGINNTPDMSTLLGNQDGLVVKYDQSGNSIWAFKIGSAGSDVSITGVEIGGSGNIFITGHFNDVCEFQGVTTSPTNTVIGVPGDFDVFIASYDSDGNLLWVNTGSNTGEGIANDIAVNSNYVYGIGWFENTVTFTGAPPQAANDGMDTYVIAYDQVTGAYVWLGHAGDIDGCCTVNDRGYAIAADDNEVYFTGTFTRTTEFNGGPTSVTAFTGGFRTIYLAEYDATTGTVNSATAIGGNLGCEARGLAVDANFVFMTGGLEGNVNFPLFGPAVAIPGSGEELFVSAFNRLTMGTTWVEVMDNNSGTTTIAEDVVTDGFGNVYVTGPFRGTTNFGGGSDPQVAGGNNDAFVMAIKDAGTYLWTKTASSGNDVSGQGVSYDDLGGVYVAGVMASQATMSPLPALGNAGGDEAFIAKINCSACIATFTYAASTFCSTSSDPIPTITGDPGGQFTGPAGIVFTDGSPSSSGTIDLSASTIGGPYTITYTAPGFCTATFDVTIEGPQNTTFTYPSAAYCSTGTDPVPTPTTAGGTYTGAAGIVFTDGSPSPSGTIDLSASTIGGPYIITYITPNSCAATGTFNVTIEGPQNATFTYPSATYCSSGTDPVPTPTTAGGTYTGAVGIVFTDGSPSPTGTIDLSASTVGGPYVITYTTPNSCAATGTFNVTIEGPQNATFTYPSATYCSTGTDPVPTPTTAGGTYTGAAGIVFTDGSPSATGTIDLSASTIGGPYIITYTTPNSCAATGTFNITIEGPQNVTFTYPAATYCSTQADPVPTPATAGGTYTGAAGIVFTDGSPSPTGTIDLSASTAGGPYVITYTTPNSCAATGTFNITIISGPTTANAGAAQLICVGTSATMAGNTPSAGTGMWTVVSGSGTITTPSSPTTTITSLGPGLNQFMWTISNPPCAPSTATVDITLDNTPPTINCPADFNENADAGCQFTIPDYTGLATGLADNCGVGGLTITQVPIAGTIVGLGATGITLTATDALGNSAACNFTITVQDGTNPMVGCPIPLAVNNDPGLCSAVVNGIGVTSATDNCGVPTVTWDLTGATTGSGSGDASGQTFNVGVTILTYTVTDAVGNTVSCSSAITVTDNENPSVVCPIDITVSNDVGNCDAVVSWTTPTPSDNCPGVVIAQTSGPLNGGAFPVGTNVVTYTATDAAGNTATCSFNVIVNDNESPTLVCPTDQNESVNTSCQFVLPDYTSLAVVADNCTATASIVITQLPIAGTTISANTVITLNADDGNGNSSVCNFNVLLQDNAAPVLTCPSDQTEYVDGNCDFVIPDYTSILVVNDNCDPSPAVVQTPLTGTIISGNGTVQVITFNVTDVDGNTSNCSFSVTLSDTISPALTCPGNQNETPGVNCSFVLPDYTSLVTGVLDNCTASAAVTVTQSPIPTTVIMGNTTITVTADDGNGNTASCTFDVILTDITLPAIACANDTTVNNDAGLCNATINLGIPVASDDCGITSLLNDFNGTSDASDTYPIGATTVTWTATDGSSNTNTCTMVVTVIDVELPVITCLNDTTISNDAGACDAVFNYAIAVSDNCSATSAQSVGLTSGSTFPIGVTTNTFIATDASGNTATCSFTVTVVDTELPTIICPVDIVLCDTNVVIPLPTTADNCAVSTVTNNYNGTANASDIYPFGTTIVVWTVIDAAGNSATCSMNVTVDEPPTLVDAGPDQTLNYIFETNLDATSPGVGTGIWSNAAGNGSIWNTTDPGSFIDQLSLGDNVVTWTVTNGTCPSVSDIVIIHVNDVFIPEAITPNFDGQNDYWVISGIEQFESEIEIFNRWGQVVYNTSNYQNNWYGLNNDGAQLSNDTYYYIVTINEQTYNGFVVLKR